MLTFTIAQPESPQKYVAPIIFNYADRTFTLLIDTGAGVPVWVGGKREFDKRFPGAKPLNRQIAISGFGGRVDNKDKSRLSELYCIPRFCLTDTKEYLIYRNMVIALQDMDANYQMIVSYTMLSGINFSYTPISKETANFSIDQPTGFVNFKQYKLEGSDIPYIESLQVLTQAECEKLIRHEKAASGTTFFTK